MMRIQSSRPHFQIVLVLLLFYRRVCSAVRRPTDKRAKVSGADTRPCGSFNLTWTNVCSVCNEYDNRNILGQHLVLYYRGSKCNEIHRMRDLHRVSSIHTAAFLIP